MISEIDSMCREISEFIASRRLHCKIDKVSGLIESEKVDKRNDLYQQAIKQVRIELIYMVS